jgi:hypothetical protein
VTVNPASVPTLVKEEAKTLDAKVAPVNVPAAAVTVMSAEPLKDTPLINLGVARVVAVPALPVVEPEEPVTLPTIGAVTVNPASVPTDVREELTTLAARVVPVNVPAAAIVLGTTQVGAKVVPLL